MRTLTIFASILLPLTLVASIHGMNGLDLNSLAKIPFRFYCCANINGSDNECYDLSFQEKEMDYFQRKQSVT
jgi:hypothetical protein